MEKPWEDDPTKDRNAAIMGSAFVEHALRQAITTHLAKDSIDPTHKYLFEADDAPFREFSTRIRLARALGIIHKSDYDQIEAIRHIRNAFAHTISKITFSTPEIAAYFADFQIDWESDPIQPWTIIMSPYAGGLLGSLPPSHASRFLFVYIVFRYYWYLIIYPGRSSEEEPIASALSLARSILK
jgi:hypothetical protein